jgi:hypothetical protein
MREYLRSNHVNNLIAGINVARECAVDVQFCCQEESAGRDKSYDWLNLSKSGALINTFGANSALKTICKHFLLCFGDKRKARNIFASGRKKSARRARSGRARRNTTEATRIAITASREIN